MPYNKNNNVIGVDIMAIFKAGLKQFLRIVVVNIMCFFIVVSFSVLATAAFTKNIGYTAYGTVSGSDDPEELYTYYYEDGEDTKKQEYIDKGYAVTESSVRSVLSGTGKTVYLAVSQIFCLMLLICFIYPNLWQLGTKDSNLVKFKHEKEDKLKGLKIGLISVVPIYIFLLCPVAAKIFGFNFSPLLFKTLNPSFFSLIEVILNGARTVAELSAWRYILLMLLPLIIPAVSAAAYILGYKNISVGEKMIYKKKNGENN